jgi:2-polyprenyl-6-methoxyphenol hydroxylase-like FAD-dependent oxidoreductase
MTPARSPADAQILIVGAGPSGLVLALWLAKMGVRARIIDKAAEPGTTSRALAVQARTLEFYRQIGLSQSVIDRGHRVAALNLWVRQARAAHVRIEDMGEGLSPFSFPIIFPQDEHERLLIERLSEAGVQVERNVELTGFEERADGIHATVRNAAGTEETVAVAYLAGCDGARSKVREVLQTGFPGGTYDHFFYVADVQAAGAPMDGELHVALDTADFLAVFPLKGAGRARLIGSVKGTAGADREHLAFDDVSDAAIQNLKVEVQRVNWFSTYHVHHRVAHHFRKGRAFLVGDAAHVHSPVGGQGMNTGIGDAINLAWKLAAVLNHAAAERVLDSYEPERIAFARRLVATTDRVFTGVISPTALARFVRTRLVPLLAPLAFSFRFVRRFAFMTVSQIAINYRGSALSAGRAGRVHGGDRLPWTPLDPSGGGEDNHAPLASLDWQLHIYGAAAPELAAFALRRALPLHVFPWRTGFARAGLARDAVYLLRPDGYVGVAEPGGGVDALGDYLDRHSLRPRP